MCEVQWRRVNSEPFEYAIQQGPFGDEFVMLLDGSCLRRPVIKQMDTRADEIVMSWSKAKRDYARRATK